MFLSLYQPHLPPPCGRNVERKLHTPNTQLQHIKQHAYSDTSLSRQSRLRHTTPLDTPSLHAAPRPQRLPLRTRILQPRHGRHMQRRRRSRFSQPRHYCVPFSSVHNTARITRLTRCTHFHLLSNRRAGQQEVPRASCRLGLGLGLANAPGLAGHGARMQLVGRDFARGSCWREARRG